MSSPAFLAVLAFLLLIIALFFLSDWGNTGKNWGEVMYEVNTFYQVAQVEDRPDRKVWIGKMRENSLSPATLTATRLPNGKWKTELQHIDVRIR